MSLLSLVAFGQAQDVAFHLNAKLLSGKTILKVKRDFYDPYLWVLAQNNEIYRVNSLTLAVDDYTSTFAPYSNLQFIDIAGRSKDTVFIATNSTNVVQYKNINIRLVGTVDGIPGTVNSIGMEIGSNDSFMYEPRPDTLYMLIATNYGLRYYNTTSEKMYTPRYTVPDFGVSQVYEASYRTTTFKDSSIWTTSPVGTDTIQYQPVVFNPTGLTTYLGYVWEGGNEFGEGVNTAVSVYDAINGGNGIWTNYYWGNGRGMFQNTFDYSYYSIYVPAQHFLDGINVNKITTIYGLVAFGDGGEDTNYGLIKQNLLVGTDQGLYFSSSIYTSYVDYTPKLTMFHDDELGDIKINDISVNAVSMSPICENGVWLAANDGLYYLKPDYGKFIEVQQVNAIQFKDQPAVSQEQICTGTSTTANLYSYLQAGLTVQWYKDGQEIPAASADTLAITAAGNYYAVLYDPCSGISLQSNNLQVRVISSPVFTFNYPDQINLCSGTTTTLQAQGNGAYQYRWYNNNVLTGDTTASISITQAGRYRVDASACSGSWVPSKTVSVNFISLPVPAIQTDKTVYCIGNNATLSINTPLDTGYTINWYQDNNVLPAQQNITSLTTNIPGNYAVTVTSNLINCSQTSVAAQLVFNPPPTISIQKIIPTTLCDGQTVDLKVNYTGGTVKWSTGANTDQISVGTSGTYTATVTSPAGCVADTSINVQFLANPVLNLKDTTICVFTRQVVTLTAPPGFTYNWNNGAGTMQTYPVSSPQTVSLTITDTSGCQASQQIVVSAQCPDVLFANTFTPNGDGVNDTWTIDGIENDYSALIRVYNRYGSLVFENRGQYTPWNGQYQGKRLPPGTYYYIISAKNGKQTFTGSVTILY
jgi:gliding motility-associated-like protein